MFWDFAADGSRSRVAFHTYRELAERCRSLCALAVMKPWQPTLVSAAEPERFDGQFVSANYFRVLGVSPALGRDFGPSDDRLNGPHVVILSEALGRRFGSDRTIIGRQITLDDSSYTVIGIMASFENILARSAELWTPLQYGDANAVTFQTKEWGNHLRMIGRLQTGVSTDQARCSNSTLRKALWMIGQANWNLSLPKFRWRANFASLKVWAGFPKRLVFSYSRTLRARSLSAPCSARVLPVAAS